MWFVILTSFLAVASAAWFALQPAQAEPVPVSGPRPVTRTDHRMDRLLERLQIPLSARDVILVTLATAAGAAILLMIATGQPTFGLLAGLAVPIGVVVMLQRSLSVSQVHLTAQLPDALLMMINALKAGHTLSHAFQTLGNEMPAPLGPAFHRLDRALQMGQSPEAALHALRDSLGNAEVDMVVQAILIQRETGGNLAEILFNIQDTLRERLKLKGKVRALTAQGKLSGLVVGVLPFALFLFLWTTSQSYLMPFLLNPIGQQALILALLAQVTGFVIIHRIVNFPI